MAQGSILGGPNGVVVLGGAVALLAIPSAVLGLSAGFDPARVAASAQSGLDSLSDDALDPALARAVTLRGLERNRSGADLFGITPGRADARIRNGVTVAVRIDPNEARAIQTRTGATGAASRMSQTAYNLGVSRGFRSFSEDMVPDARPGAQPLADLAAFKLTPGAQDKPSRFSGRVAIDEQVSTGRSPRTFDGEGAAMVDVGGAFRLSSTLAVTAGVRYTQAERDRLVPLTDGRQDEQAVYVGTRFKF